MTHPRIGAKCHIDRDRCLITPTRWYETQFPESFDMYLAIWEWASVLLLEPGTDPPITCPVERESCIRLVDEILQSIEE